MVFPGINKTQAVELLEEIRGNIRRQIFGLPTKKQTPTLGEYARIYLDLCKSEKENTVAAKKRAITVLTFSLGEYQLDKITPFIIEKYRINRKANNSDDRVFETREITNDVVVGYSKHFSVLFKRLGIHNFTYHNLRHTFSSILQGELGVGAVVVGMTGHSSLSMLQKYSHAGLENKQNAIQALTEHVLNVSQKTCLNIAQ